MAILETLQDINLRVANIIQHQQQLKAQAQNWEHLYKEATDVQKKLLEQSTGYAKQNEILHLEISKLKADQIAFEQKHQQVLEKLNDSHAEIESAQARHAALNKELQTLKLKEEQQLSLHFGAEREQEQLKALNEDLKEQLAASQQLNQELQSELQLAKIKMVEDQSASNALMQQKGNLEKELEILKEKYRLEVSELHSKNSQVEDQTEKLNAETRKLQEALNELMQSNTQKQEASELLKQQMEALEAQLNATPVATEEEYLRTRIAQLNAQIGVFQFEKELMKKVFSQKEQVQPANVSEVVNQQPAGNSDQFHFLYSELQASQAMNAELEKKLNYYIEAISKANKIDNSESETLKNLQEQNKIVKLAEVIEGNTVASNIELRQKLSEMIKEVDRCIAKLSS